MRILFNGLAVSRGGSKTYFSNVIPCLWPLGKEHKFFLLHSPGQSAFDFDLPPNFTRLIAGPKSRSLPLRFMWEQMRLPGLIRGNQIDVVFLPTAASCLSPRCPTVLTVRNSNIFLRLDVNDLRYQLRNRLLLALTRIAVKQASFVIFVSDYSRKKASKVLRLNANKTTVVYHGTGQHFFDSPRNLTKPLFDGPRPYVLTVGNIENHKNYPRLLDGFARLCRDPDMGYDYVFAGAVGSKKEFVRIQERVNQPDLKGRVHYLGEIPNEDLPGLYRKASLFVLPSLLETFGHPLVEAMASGTPVAASRAGAIPEICREAAVYFDPENTEDLTATIHRALADDGLRSKLVKAGRERAEKFSWTRTAAKMLDLFEASVRPQENGKNLCGLNK